MRSTPRSCCSEAPDQQRDADDRRTDSGKEDVTGPELPTGIPCTPDRSVAVGQGACDAMPERGLRRPERDEEYACEEHLRAAFRPTLRSRVAPPGSAGTSMSWVVP